MAMLRRLTWAGICGWLALAAGAPLAAAATVREPVYRFLFVVDTSFSMGSRGAQVRDSVYELIRGGCQGRMRPSDPFGLWTFDDEVRTAAFVRLHWDPLLDQLLANKAYQFLDQVDYRRQTRLDRAVSYVLAAVRESDEMVVLLYTDGEESLSGTPFDTRVNAEYQRRKRELRRARLPFITVFHGVDGELRDVSVHAPADLVLPELRPSAAPAPPALAAPAPPPQSIPPVDKTPSVELLPPPTEAADSQVRVPELSQPAREAATPAQQPIVPTAAAKTESAISAPRPAVGANTPASDSSDPSRAPEIASKTPQPITSTPPAAPATLPAAAPTPRPPTQSPQPGRESTAVPPQPVPAPSSAPTPGQPASSAAPAAVPPVARQPSPVDVGDAAARPSVKTVGSAATPTADTAARKAPVAREASRPMPSAPALASRPRTNPPSSQPVGLIAPTDVRSGARRYLVLAGVFLGVGCLLGYLLWRGSSARRSGSSLISRSFDRGPD